jgi:hypothetical protein
VRNQQLQEILASYPPDADVTLRPITTETEHGLGLQVTGIVAWEAWDGDPVEITRRRRAEPA